MDTCTSSAFSIGTTQKRHMVPRLQAYCDLPTIILLARPFTNWSGHTQKNIVMYDFFKTMNMCWINNHSSSGFQTTCVSIDMNVKVGQILKCLHLSESTVVYTLYGLARAVSPTNTNFRLTFLLTRLQEALYEDLAV